MANPKPQDVLPVIQGPVDLLLIATALAQLERERCDKIQRRMLATGKYGGDGNPKTTYLLTDEAAKRYFADLDQEYLDAGYTMEPGHCPALTAEYMQTKAEWAMIEAAEPFFGVTNDKLLCGVKGMGGLETRQKYLNLLIGFVVNSPGYVPPHRRKERGS